MTEDSYWHVRQSWITWCYDPAFALLYPPRDPSVDRGHHSIDSFWEHFNLHSVVALFSSSGEVGLSSERRSMTTHLWQQRVIFFLVASERTNHFLLLLFFPLFLICAVMHHAVSERAVNSLQLAVTHRGNTTYVQQRGEPLLRTIAHTRWEWVSSTCVRVL